MNLIFLGIIIFIFIILALSAFAKANTQKISKKIRFLIIIFSIFVGIVLVFAGRILIAAPIFLLILPLINILNIGKLRILMKFWIRTFN